MKKIQLGIIEYDGTHAGLKLTDPEKAKKILGKDTGKEPSTDDAELTLLCESLSAVMARIIMKHIVDITEFKRTTFGAMLLTIVGMLRRMGADEEDIAEASRFAEKELTEIICIYRNPAGGTEETAVFARPDKIAALRGEDVMGPEEMPGVIVDVLANVIARVSMTECSRGASEEHVVQHALSAVLEEFSKYLGSIEVRTYDAEEIEPLQQMRGKEDPHFMN